MEKGNIAIVLLLLLFSSFRQTLLQDIPFSDHCKFSFTRCITTGQFKKIYNISPLECVTECSRRPKCQSFNYKQRFHGCELSSDAGTENNLRDCIGFVHSNIEEWNSEWRKFCKSLNCSVGQTCVKDKTGNGSCIYTECDRPDVNSDTVLLGNVYDVGSRLKIQCKEGTVVIGKDTTKCLENGTWTPLGRCLNYICPNQMNFCYRTESRVCKTWTEARDTCQSEGGDLMNPDEDTFQFFIDKAELQNYGQCGSFWVGGYSNKTELNFVSVRGNSIPMSFRYWFYGQPDLSNENCLELQQSYGYYLNNYVCDKQDGFICQIYQ
ncbi:hypothetical protein ACJMK2_028459 [Sinanodonta woodiana]|uniref:Uncharacterized protein n=1 Tax=Sinanodonta woodiana TaxID=1069815 RepID=A0ABD3X7Q0_SINWO